jgi:hypothetical protein
MGAGAPTERNGLLLRLNGSQQSFQCSIVTISSQRRPSLDQITATLYVGTARTTQEGNARLSNGT